MWDVFAVSTYVTTSVLFWYMGMIPDLATFRDRRDARQPIKALDLRHARRSAGAARPASGTATSART